MSVIQDIVSYINLNRKQCGINVNNVNNINIERLIEDTRKINIRDNNVDNKGLYFDILRECIYRKNIKFNPVFKKSDWYSLFTENFFRICIHCKCKLTSVNWNCCDIFCENCETKYECKSFLSYYNYKNNILIHLGQLCGVYDFLENNNNVLVKHFLNGYYILPVNNLKKHTYVNYKIFNKKEKKYVITFNNYEDLKVYIQDNSLFDFDISKNLTLDLIVPSQILMKRKVNCKIDINRISREIYQINKIYPCLLPDGNIKALLYHFEL